jgi:glycosyltransferase involved in cell wall biosynthesis
LIRLYGHDTLGSFGVVTRGVKSGLEELGVLSGFLPVNAIKEDVSYPGAEASISLNAGAPLQILSSHVLGRHEKFWSILAVNSQGIPIDLKKKMEGTVYNPSRGKKIKMVDRFLATSTWCREVLEKEFPEHPVGLYLHGVQSHFKVLEEERKKVRESDGFRALHVTSTRTQRKGTYELLRAWKELNIKNGELVLLVNPTLAYSFGRYLKDNKIPSTKVLSGLSFTDKQMLYGFSQTHVVIQPSRAEGFGLVPLEARACGVPVVATDCTGHADHVQGPGVQVVETGPLEEIDDYPGAVAPRLTWESVADALLQAHDKWRELDADAMAHASIIQEEWSWKNVTKKMLRENL